MATFESQFSLTGPWASMWQNTEADATVLTAMLLKKYGEQALDWDPLTIRLEIESDFHVTPVDENMNKLCAMQIVMASGDFFERIDAFINVCNSISEGDPFFEVFTPLESEEMALALSTVAMNRDMLPFSDTIRRYVKETLKADGFSNGNFPEIFSAVFDRQPSSKQVRHTVSEMVANPTAAESNSRNIASMLAQNVGVMFAQFNSIPGLEKLDDHLLEHGMIMSLGEQEK